MEDPWPPGGDVLHPGAVPGDSILAFAAEQLRERRTNRLAVERERTKQASLARDRDALVWHQLGSVTDTNDQASKRS